MNSKQTADLVIVLETVVQTAFKEAQAFGGSYAPMSIEDLYEDFESHSFGGAYTRITGNAFYATSRELDMALLDCLQRGTIEARDAKLYPRGALIEAEELIATPAKRQLESAILESLAEANLKPHEIMSSVADRELNPTMKEITEALETLLSLGKIIRQKLSHGTFYARTSFGDW